MADNEQQQNSLAQDANNAASAVGAAARAAGKAASGNVVGAAIDVVTNKRLRNIVLAILFSGIFLIASCAMIIGSAITGTVENLARNWSENWDENWEEQGIASNGSALYQYTIGAMGAFGNTVTDLFATEHEVDGRSAMNKDLYDHGKSDSLTEKPEPNENTKIELNDYNTTIKSIFDEESLVSADGALMKRINMIKGRVEERGEQILFYSIQQYGWEAIGLTVANILVEEFNNPTLYYGVDLKNCSVVLDTSAFALSDIQALKILAAYSVQHDCDIANIDMFDLMDYCGWYDFAYAPLNDQFAGDQFGKGNIYSKGTFAATMEDEIGGVIAAGEAIKSYQLNHPIVKRWRGTAAPQWYYEQIAQIREHNNLYDHLNPENQEKYELWYIEDENGELDTVQWVNLNEFETYGIIDRIYTSGVARLSIGRTEYQTASEIAEEAIDKFIAMGAEADPVLKMWQQIVADETGDTGAGTVFSEDDIHSYTLKHGTSSQKNLGSTNTYITFSYYLYNTGSGSAFGHRTVANDGADITWNGLSPESSYQVMETVTFYRNTPEGTSEKTNQYTRCIDEFTTFADNVEGKAFRLQFNATITFAPVSIDELTLEILGLWPGSFEDIDIGANGREYAKGYANNELLAKTWTDTYIDENGEEKTIYFHRQSDYQLEAYNDIVESLAKTLCISTIGLAEPTTLSAGHDIVAMANAEYEYYHANGLTGGMRYWEMARDEIGWHFGYDAPWCVAFVYCMAHMCGYIGEGLPFGPNWVFGVGQAYYQITGNGDAIGYRDGSSKYKPVPGDIIVFDQHPNLGTLVHIGIVEYVDEENQVHVIHGNWSNSVQKSVFPSYEIGSYISSNHVMRVAGYIHPNYPQPSEEPLYVSISGKTSSSVTSRYIADANDQLLLSGVGRLRPSQLFDFIDQLEESYPILYTEGLRVALYAGDLDAFQAEWNKISSSQRSLSFKSAQLKITEKLYITPLAQATQAASNFDWTASDARRELLWAIATTTDQQDAVRRVLSVLTSGMSLTISDKDFIDAIKEHDYLNKVLRRYADEIWPNDGSQLQVAWVSSIISLLDKLSYNLNYEGSNTDNFYVSARNVDPNYHGHSVNNLTERQIYNIKNTMYGTYGYSLAGMIAVAQTIRDNVDRDPSVTYDNFVYSCKYYGGYPTRNPSEYDTELVNQAFQYVFVEGGSAVQHSIHSFYAPDPPKLVDDEDYRDLFNIPISFVEQIGSFRFFSWE